jgi:hypothetical protein
MAWTEPIKLPTEDSDEISTSSGRPSSRSTTASIVSAEASGYVPAVVLDGARATSGSTVERGEDLIALENISVGSFLQMLGTYV